MWSTHILHVERCSGESRARPPPPFLSWAYMALRQKLEVLYTVYVANLDLAHGIPVLEIRVHV